MISQAVSLHYPNDLETWEQLYKNEEFTAKALAGFRQFSAGFISFFEEVIAQKQFDPEQTTPARLRSRAMHALEDYWAPLGEVVLQRQVEHYRTLLDQGTELAQGFVDELETGLSGVLLYFDKVATIKYCPYSDIAFIGTPYAQSVVEDWMALPHELGHYLYWNLGASLKETREKQEQLKNGADAILKNKGIMDPLKYTLLQWSEEIVCDIVGVKTAGSDFFTKFADYVKGRAGSTKELAANDGRHPPLWLRPLIREHAFVFRDTPSGVNWDLRFNRLFGKHISEISLRASLPDLEEAVRALDKKQLLAMLEAEDPMEAALLESPVFEPFTVDDIKPAVEAIVEYFYGEIEKLSQVSEQPERKPRTFEQLRELAVEEAVSQDKALYEILLRPRILEGGEYDEAHSCWAHWTWDHWMSGHYH